MESPLTGKIFDIKKYAIHDGPGIRTTIFFKDCPLSCWWCHNPEGLQRAPKVIYDPQRCIGCYDCFEACPQGAISKSQTGPLTNDKRCTGCGTCVDICAAGARQMSEQLLTVSQLMDIIQQDIVFYDESGGGVTFSGGEPLLQPDFLNEVLIMCGQYEVHRTVDTSGFASRVTIKKIAMHTDLFLYDLKHMDSERHRHFTGVPNETILENLIFIHNLNTNIIVRIPLIPGINDDDENLGQVGRFLQPLENIREIHILPYHGYQKNKYCKLGIPYLSGHISEPTHEQISDSIKKLEGYGLQVNLGG